MDTLVPAVANTAKNWVVDQITKRWHDLFWLKYNAGTVESFRQFYLWYNAKWKHDYPDLYANRWDSNMPKRGFKRAQMAKVGESKRKRPIPKCVRLEPSYAEGERSLLLKTRQLGSYTLSNIARGSLNTQRLLFTADISYIRLRFSIQNVYNGTTTEGTTPTFPLFCNVAILGHPEPITSVPTSDFYKVPGAIGFPYKSFDEAWDGIAHATNAINSDKYGIVWHTRFRLANANTSDGFGAGSYHTHKTIYRSFRINRRFNFTGDTGTSCETPLFLVFWVSGFNELSDTVERPACLIQFNTTTYFREPPQY